MKVKELCEIIEEKHQVFCVSTVNSSEEKMDKETLLELYGDYEIVNLHTDFNDIGDTPEFGYSNVEVYIGLLVEKRDDKKLTNLTFEGGYSRGVPTEISGYDLHPIRMTKQSPVDENGKLQPSLVVNKKKKIKEKDIVKVREYDDITHDIENYDPNSTVFYFELLSTMNYVEIDKYTLMDLELESVNEFEVLSIKTCNNINTTCDVKNTKSFNIYHDVPCIIFERIKKNEKIK